MEQDNKINNILLEILKDLNQLINYYKDNFSIKIVGNVINKINCIINENKKNLQTQRNDMSSLFDKLNKRFDKLEINNINKQELKRKEGKYIGQVVNGLADGKGIWYGFNGDRYEGEFKNGKAEGKGIYYYNNGDRYEGEWRNYKQEGKGIFYWNNGDRYEGDFRNHKREGKAIYYYSNGDRMMGDYYNDKPIGKHIRLTKNGDVKIENF